MRLPDDEIQISSWGDTKIEHLDGFNEAVAKHTGFSGRFLEGKDDMFPHPRPEGFRAGL